MWLESQLQSGSGSNVASSSASQAPNWVTRSTFEKKLGDFFKHQIESDTSPVYGDGFRIGHQAVQKYGLPQTLDHIRITGRFPYWSPKPPLFFDRVKKLWSFSILPQGQSTLQIGIIFCGRFQEFCDFVFGLRAMAPLNICFWWIYYLMRKFSFFDFRLLFPFLFWYKTLTSWTSESRCQCLGSLISKWGRQFLFIPILTCQCNSRLFSAIIH